MRKVLLLASAVCFAASTASAFEFNPYVAARAKYAFERNEIKYTGTFDAKEKLNKNVFGGSIAAGTTWDLMNGDFRFELEYTRNADAKKDGGKVKTQGVLFNVYYDFDLQNMPVKPYVSAGLGWGRSEWEGATRKVKDDSASAQIGAGASYQINENIAFDLGYRYITYGDFDEERRIGLIYEKADYKPRAHEILFGVRYAF